MVVGTLDVLGGLRFVTGTVVYTLQAATQSECYCSTANATFCNIKIFLERDYFIHAWKKIARAGKPHKHDKSISKKTQIAKSELL